MILYTCKSEVPSPPGPFGHPCAKAAKALTQAGYEYEQRRVDGGIMKPWTLPKRAQDRAEVERLSGQRGVPILVLDDESVITGSGAIVRWAREHPRPSA